MNNEVHFPNISTRLSFDFLKREIKFLILLFLIFFVLLAKSIAQINTTRNVTGNWEDPSSWVSGAGDYTGVYLNGASYSVYGNITRTGNIVEQSANLDIYGNLTIKSGYFSNSSANLVIKSGGMLTVFGDFNAVSSVTIEAGGILAVYGNINITSGSVAMAGDVVVRGDFNVNGSGTNVTSTGNLVVGSNFNFTGGGFTTGKTNNNFYVITPGATITTPNWPNDVCEVGNTTCYYGNSTNFLNNESQPLKDLVALMMGCIIANPVNTIGCAGSSAILGVSAWSSALAYQWQISVNGGSSFTNISDGSQYSGTNTANLSILNIASGQNNYQYRCSVGGGCTSVSTAAVLTVNIPPTITSQPVNQTSCDNSLAPAYSISASGSSISYQWQTSSDGNSWANISNGYPYNNVTTSTLNINSYSSIASGTFFRCQAIANSCPAYSNPAMLIKSAPAAAGTITGNATACKEQTGVAYSVPLITGAISYEWVYSGANASISGSTQNVSIDFATSATSGNLQVRGTNACGNGSYSPAYAITVFSAPGISTQPATQSTCEGSSISFTVAGTGSGISYQWTKNGTDISGATLASLTLSSVTASDAAAYIVQVTQNGCSTLSNTANLTVNTSPVITSQPQNISQAAGTTAQLSVTATGSGLSYQWRKGGVNISGATLASLTLTNISTANAGNYDVIVSNSTGCSVSSNSCTITVLSVPANDNFSNAFEIIGACSGDAQYTTLGATADKNKGYGWVSGPNCNVWFKFQATSIFTSATIKRGGTLGNSQRLQAAIWKADGITQVAANQYSNDADNVMVQSADLVVGDWYYISVDNSSVPYSGSFTLCLQDNSLIWTGNTSNDWNIASNWSKIAIPTATDYVIIPTGRSNYPETNSGANAVANYVEIKENACLSVPSGKSLTVGNDFRIRSSSTGTGSFIDFGQIIINGNIYIERYAVANSYHYISAPLADASAAGFNDCNTSYPNQRFYYYDETYPAMNKDWQKGWKQELSAGNLTVGKGYTLLSDENRTYYFSGKNLNSGDIPCAITRTLHNWGSETAKIADGWNLIGNPYPSAVDADAFVSANSTVITGALYFWGYIGRSGYRDDGSDYATWSKAGGIGNSKGGGTYVPDGIIAPAQGFFVRKVDNGASSQLAVVNFNNAMRTNSASHFFKKTEKNIQRIWLSVESPDKNYNEILLAFTTAASKDFDPLYDALKLKGNKNLAFYSVLRNNDLCIQAQDLLTEEDTVRRIPLGLDVETTGTYQFALNNIEKLSERFLIYFHDKASHRLIKLKKAQNWEVFLTANQYRNRFEIIISTTEISQSAGLFSQPVKIYTNNKQVIVELPDAAKEGGNLRIIDLMGRTLVNKGFANEYLLTLTVGSAPAIYIVEVKYADQTNIQKVYISQ